MASCLVDILSLCARNRKLSYPALTTIRKTCQYMRFCYLCLFQSVGIDVFPVCLGSRDSAVKS